MFARPLVLCPTDFSEPSRGALRYAGALAEHFYADLMVLAVDDPFLTASAAAAMDEHFLERQTRAALTTFVNETFAARPPHVPQVREHMVTGRPADEILRCAEHFKADVIVMSTHGASGVRKLVFGSVTERVLRNTYLPVLVTPGADRGPESLDTWMATIKRMLVPVDFSDWTPQQVAIARGLAEALHSELLFAHVMPADGEGLSRPDVHHRMDELIRSVPSELRAAMTIARGDAAVEIARLAREREANLIVMGLHSSPSKRQHMGHVTYRLLCEAPVLVVAWPPARPGHTLVTKGNKDVVIV
jgi:nucleotide-binding universal stress UspA family protein